jgi:hypothetical protein
VDTAVVIGYETGTTKLFFSSSTPELSLVLILLERAKHEVMKMLDES